MSVEKMLDRPIAFQRVFMELGAGASGALFLSQAVYWSNRTSNSEKWFYKTIEEWTQETGLSRHEQDGARKKLKAKGVLEIIKKGIPCKTYYRVNFEKLGEILGVISATNKNAEIRQTGMPESGKLNCQEPANSCAENQQTITEITTQTTAEITSKDLLSDSGESNVPAVVDDSASFDAKAKRELLAEAFERVWVGYGRRGSKKPAEEKFLKIKLPNNRSEAIGLLQAIIDKAKQWGDLYAQHPSEVQFQPHAVRWVKEEKWNDEELPTIRNNGQSSRDWATEMVNEEERF